MKVEWLKGKVIRFSAGQTAVLLKGNEKEVTKKSKDEYTQVKESIRKIVLNGRWGAEIEYQIGEWSDGTGNYKGITAIKIIKEGPRTNYQKGKGVFRPPEELTAIECLKFALKEFELNRGMGPANETLNTKNVSAKAKQYATEIKIIAKEIKGE